METASLSITWLLFLDFSFPWPTSLAHVKKTAWSKVTLITQGRGSCNYPSSLKPTCGLNCCLVSQLPYIKIVFQELPEVAWCFGRICVSLKFICWSQSSNVFGLENWSRWLRQNEVTRGEPQSHSTWVLLGRGKGTSGLSVLTPRRGHGWRQGGSSPLPSKVTDLPVCSCFPFQYCYLAWSLLPSWGGATTLLISCFFVSLVICTLFCTWMLEGVSALGLCPRLPFLYIDFPVNLIESHDFEHSLRAASFQISVSISSGL